MTIPLRNLTLVLLFSFGFVSMVIGQTCQADFSYTLNGLSVQFTQQATAASPITGYLWNFGDGTTSTQPNPLHTYADSEDLLVCLTITTANGCTDQFCATVEPCQLNLAVTVGDCNANGEIPLVVAITDVFGNAKDVHVFLDGVLFPGSPFEIDTDLPVTLNTLVAGDGQVHEIEVVSTDNPACGAVYTFTAPDCGAGCFLSGLNVALAQGGLKTVNIGDNFFNPVNTTIVIGDLVRFNWTTSGHTSTSDAATGPDSWNSGELGAGATYEVRIKNPGAHRFYCIPHGGPGGVGMSGMIVANCPAGNNFTLQVTFNTTQASPAGYNLWIDGVLQPGSPHAYSGTGLQSLTATLAGDGLNHTLEIQDIATPECLQTRTFTAPDCGAAPACSMSVAVNQTNGCNTASQVTVAVQVNSVNGGAAGFEVLVDGIVAAGPFPYSTTGITTVSIPVAGDGLSHTIAARDMNTIACQGSALFVSPNCTTPCSLSNAAATTGGGVTHVVEVQDFQFVPQNITIAAGDRVEWHWTGMVAHTSTSDATAGPDSWNSGLLHHSATFLSPVLSAGIHPYYCIPHGAPGGIGMSGVITVQADCANGQVPVALSFSESGGGFGGFQVWLDTVATGPFPYTTSGLDTLSLLVPGDGQVHTLLVQDLDNAGCNTSVTITTPDCNASTCQLALSVRESGPCDTLLQVPVEVLLTDLGGNPGGFLLYADDVLVDTFLYGANDSTLVSLLLPGDGLPHTLTARDLTDPLCMASDSLITSNCILPCQLDNLQLSSGSNGNPVIHTVEVVDFSFIPNHLIVSVGDIVRFVWNGHIHHTTTSDATTGADVWNSGLLGHGSVFEVTITTEGVHPYYCIPHGAPGGIGMAGDITATPPCNNGQVVVNASFSEINGSTEGYVIKVDGQVYPGSPFMYQASGINEINLQIPGDGLNHLILIEDVLNNGCAVSGVIQTPDCSTGCSISNLNSTGSSCENGIAVTTFSFTATGPGTQGYNVFIDGILEPGSPYNYASGGSNTLDLPVNGDGGVHTIRLEDVADSTCTVNGSFTTPLCPGACIVVTAAQSGICNTENQAPFSVTVQAIAPGTTGGFDLLIDGVLYPGSPFAYQSGGTTIIPVLLPGDGMVHGIQAIDATLSDCQAAVNVLTPQCGVNCAMGNFSIEYNVPQTFTVEVRDFAFFPADLTVSVGDTVRFVWTGQIPHTTTSDVLGGPDSWNSGLLGQGAVYDLIIQAVGDHPYYCIPHGSPGGIGMSGMIRVHPPCDDGQLNVRVTFSAISGSFQGYSVYFDDNLFIHSGPYHPSGLNQVMFTAPGDGALHHVRVQDATDPACFLHEHFTMPDCGDPCFGFEASFIYQVNLQTLEVQFTDASEGQPQNWMWMFGDGGTSADPNPAHTFQAGTYPVCLAVENDDLGCVHVFCDTLFLDQVVCEPFFTLEHEGLTVFLQDHSQSSQSVRNWIWTLGNGQQISGEANPSFTYATLGNYQICLTIETDSCSATFCQQLDLSNPCLAFEPNFTYEINPETFSVQFTDQTSGSPHHWLWGFGDGVTSTLQNPTHTYSQQGVYHICLLVQDTLNGCNKALCELLYLGVTGTRSPDLEQQALLIYPNPVSADQALWRIKGISWRDDNQPLEYRISNMQGQVCRQGITRGSEDLALPALNPAMPGVYLIEMRSETAIYRGKIMVL